ncbi:hypothetical protein Hsw_1397 [Hymenobacter swuensis DY53]|uniref:Uncharacterized protein n=1 Tax=Hymenobacter swuensis DY53 TaxID=1227739 RepID=W8EZ23_9BACT|nr:hypothetical protein Hsw_1397 [Hymenobacter swuensis DY53]
MDDEKKKKIFFVIASKGQIFSWVSSQKLGYICFYILANGMPIHGSIPG